MTTKGAPRVLIVDDDLDHRTFLAEMLGDHGYPTSTSGSSAEAVVAFSREPTEVVVTDLRMQGLDGVGLIALLKKHPARPALIAITAFGSLAVEVRVLQAGAADYLSKPFAPAQLVEAIGNAVARREERLAQLDLREEVDDAIARGRP